ncbi:MFS transporter [Ktedonobacter robiniae]|uniref:MFS transporter n=1 Tax=Ktedonobacter robiniae TaxID=2778365 RepID=A0ABQ3UYZ2_9CHLR|nr:MFS transporter [Ktedonobacter robiniae]GHO58101.1 MFS transporter [Ktedonobacter robiniae]
MQNAVSVPSSRRFSIWLSFFGFMLVGISSGVSGPILPSLSAYYHVGDATIGLLLLVSPFAYFLSSLSSGLLIEKFGLRWLLLMGTAIFILGFAGFGLRLPFLWLFAARLCIGLGAGIIETGFNIYISTQPRQETLLNNLHAFFGVGSLLGPLLVSALLTLLWDWNIAYLFLVVLCLPLALGLGPLFSVPANIQDTQRDEPARKEGIFGATLKLPVVWIATLFLLVYVGVETCAGSWGYTFLLNERAQSPLIAGWIVSGYWLGLTLGRFFLQRQAERMGISSTVLVYICLICIVLSSLLAWLVPSGISAALAFCLMGLGVAPLYPLTVAIMPKLVPAHLAASAISLLISVSIIGLGVFPWLAGLLAQAVGIWTLMPFIILLTLAMIILWRILARHIASPA